MNNIDAHIETSPFMKFLQGGALAGGIASFTTPGVYFSNMVISQTKPKLSNCFRGVGLTALNDVPAAAVSFMVQGIMMKYLPIDKEKTSSKLLASGIAGACAGFVITPGEMVVLKYQQNKKQRTMIEIAKKAYRIGGVRRLFLGAPALAVREGSYTSSYFVLGELVAKLITPIIPNEELRVGVGAFFAGTLVGAATTPAKMLTVQMQAQAFSTKKITSYMTEFKKLTLRSVIRNVSIRAPTIGLASLLLTEGRRHLLSG